MKHFFVISGGAIEDSFAERLLQEQKPKVVIAADSGMDFLYRINRKPDILIGDFDSGNREALAYFKAMPDIRIEELNPVKDDTDTESAVRLAISMGAEKLTILGGTGSRLDHVLGNIELLGIGLDAGVDISIVDTHNRIRMIKKGFTIKKEEQFGHYVSLIPYTEKVEHVYLTGFKYPLKDYCLRGFCSIGVSNEILEEEAIIEFDGGILLVVESRDKE